MSKPSKTHYGVKLVFQHDNSDNDAKWADYEDYRYVYEEMIFLVQVADEGEIDAAIEKLTDQYVDDDTTYTGYSSYSELGPLKGLKDFDYSEEVYFELTGSNLGIDDYLDDRYPDGDDDDDDDDD